jgi:hypothetical protein
LIWVGLEIRDRITKLWKNLQLANELKNI